MADEIEMTDAELAAEEQAAAQGDGEVSNAPVPMQAPPILATMGQQAGSLANSGLARLGDVLTAPQPERTATMEANGDDLSDLFEGPSDEDLDINIDDLVSVDPEDIYGIGGDDMSDLVDVSHEDIMGEDPLTPRKPSTSAVHRIVRTTQDSYPAGMSGLQ